MLIYIIRHGKANTESETGKDADRMLRKKGHRQAQWLAENLRTRDEPPEMVLSSPYIRARETAEPIWEALDQTPQLDDRLSAERTLSDALDVLIDARGAGSVAIIGHNPTCARLVSTICNGLTTMPAGHRTGEMVLIEVQGDEMIGAGRLIERIRMED
ncbi:MAG: histidine phosphatase family protein [Phycisphaerales bacterium]